MALRKPVQYALYGVAAVVAVFGIRYGVNHWINKPAETVAVVLKPNFTAHFDVKPVTPYKVAMSGGTSSISGQCVDIETLPWNAISGLSYANDGEMTQPGSLMAKYTGGGCVHIKLQNDYGQMEPNLAKGQDAFYIIMGDGYPYVSLAEQGLLPGGYEVVGNLGFSNGEDKCMGPKGVANDPQKLRGVLFSAVPEDGDWDVCVKKASDNGIPVNANPHTYDPDAINFVDTQTFVDADEKLILHYCEERELVHGAFDQGKKVKVCVNGVATWTPGDVEVLEKYDGYANNIDGVRTFYGIETAASTADYRGQMPAALIGRKDFDAAHPDLVVGILKAADMGAQAINGASGDPCANGYRSNAALMRAGAVNAQIFKDKDADYWASYFCGVSRGGMILGGSRVIGLVTQADYFGLRNGTLNTFHAVYDAFAEYDRTLRPDLSPKVVPYDNIVNMTYLQQALQGVTLNTGAVNASANKTVTTFTQVVSAKSYHIEFASGSAEIDIKSYDDLKQIAGMIGMTDLHIGVNGYTDSTGSARVNTALSRARAQAVANALNRIAPAQFPLSLFNVHGYGPAKPVGDNATDEGRATNRRVEIVMGRGR